MLKADLVDCLVLHRRKNAIDMGSWFAVLEYSVDCPSNHDGCRIDQDILLGTAIGCSKWIPVLTLAENEMPAHNEACFCASWEAWCAALRDVFGKLGKFSQTLKWALWAPLSVVNTQIFMPIGANALSTMSRSVELEQMSCLSHHAGTVGVLLWVSWKASREQLLVFLHDTVFLDTFERWVSIIQVSRNDRILTFEDPRVVVSSLNIFLTQNLFDCLENIQGIIPRAMWFSKRIRTGTVQILLQCS